MSTHECLLVDLMAFVCIRKVKSFTYGAAGMVSGQHNETSREMVAIYSEHRATFSKRVINNAVEALKVIAEPMGKPAGNLLPFANGALDLKTGEFSPHTPELDHHAQRY
ncbi:hypothetical protein ACLB1N_04845 [Escherichia coli]